VRGNIIEIDNRWVVPHSPLLPKIFKAHINAEYCNSVKSIKYICKYVNKGSDMAVFRVSTRSNLDDISQYQIGRYISINEVVWRILGFQIHERDPTVVHLAVHLENRHRVYFTEQKIQDRTTNPPNETLPVFIQLCQTDDFTRTLMYADIPTYYTWNATQKNIERRKSGKAVVGQPEIFSSNALGRIYTLHHNNANCFYLCLLLIVVHGPT